MGSKNSRNSNPERGVTNNASESMNAVFHRLQQLKNVPLDVIAVSLYHLSLFYQHEHERSIHQCGQWEIKAEYDFYRRDPTLMPQLPKALNPNDIAEQVRIGVNHEIHEKTYSDEEIEPIPSNCSQIGLARLAISEDRVKLVDDGVWMVMDGDGQTPFAVRLFPKEMCSCNTTRACYHFAACRSAF
jgi:hypothetical protein